MASFAWGLMVVIGVKPITGFADDLLDGARFDDQSSAYSVRHSPDYPRSRLAPVLSFFLPGLDQWLEGQHGHALGYSLTAVAGLSLLSDTAQESEDGSDGEFQQDQFGVSESQKRFMWGNQLFVGAGGMSAYHAFRTMVKTQQTHGKYGFLTLKEQPTDILMAPFKFSYLKRSTTWIPLAVAGWLHLSVIMADSETLAEQGAQITALTGSDVFYTGAISYGAGVWEEAAFRGWILPEFMQLTHSPDWSNAITALLFSLAHLNTVSVPWIQLGLGWYFGDLTIRNNWEIGESVFIHSWWDVFAFLTVFRLEQKDALPQSASRPVYLPALEWRF